MGRSSPSTGYPGLMTSAQFYVLTVAAKTVALDNEAYAVLRERKRSSETVRAVVKRVARPRRPLADFIGIWAGESSKEAKRLDRVRVA